MINIVFSRAGDVFRTCFARRSRLLAGVIGLLIVGGAAGVAAGLGRIQAPAPDQPITVGVTYLPPPDTAQSRIYQKEGFELDLAGELERVLGVAVTPVLVKADEQAAALADGRVDALILRLEADDPLHRTARILPGGFLSGLSVVMRSDTTIRDWRDFRGRTLCLSEANARGQALAQQLGAKVLTFRAPALALIGMRTGECDAAVHDQANIAPMFEKRDWQRFNATLPETFRAPLVVAVAQDRPGLADHLARALKQITASDDWRQRQRKWAGTVAFEVFRDQVAADCH